MTDIKRETMGSWEWVAFLDRTKFFWNAKLWFKSKLLINTPQFLISTATKITCSYSFRMRLVSVSLQCGLPFSKSNGLASVLQLPFRTGSKHPKKWIAPHAGLGTKNGNVTKKIFCRVLNRPSESRGSQPSGLLLVLFVEAKRIKPFPFGNFRGFANLESVHTGGGIAGTKLNPCRCTAFPRGVGAPPPTCTRKACVPLASQALSGGKAALWRPLSGTFHLLLKKQDKTGRQGADKVHNRQNRLWTK